MDTINDSTERIQQALTAIEQEKHIRILYACESGSRAWDFASAETARTLATDELYRNIRWHTVG